MLAHALAPCAPSSEVLLAHLSSRQLRRYPSKPPSRLDIELEGAESSDLKEF